jgi:hypothetical protein
MVPVEITAFGLLAICVIVLAVLQLFALLFPRDAALRVRTLVIPALAVVVALAIYVFVTTRAR